MILSPIFSWSFILYGGWNNFQISCFLRKCFIMNYMFMSLLLVFHSVDLYFKMIYKYYFEYLRAPFTNTIQLFYAVMSMMSLQHRGLTWYCQNFQQNWSSFQLYYHGHQKLFSWCSVVWRPVRGKLLKELPHRASSQSIIFYLILFSQFNIKHLSKLSFDWMILQVNPPRVTNQNVCFTGC